MQIENLPQSAQKELDGISLMANWFNGYFTRQAQNVVERAVSNDQGGEKA